ncbi:hypothetical protein EsDP_00007529, partial [Epichloe bromicola]
MSGRGGGGRGGGDRGGYRGDRGGDGYRGDRGGGDRGGYRGDRGGGGGYRGDRGGGDRGGYRGDRGGGGGYRGDRGGGGGRGRGGGPSPESLAVFSDSNVSPVDQAVTTIEENFAAKCGVTQPMTNLSTTDSTMPLRPGYGTLGRRTEVFANYFKVNAPKDLTLTRYNIEVSAKLDGDEKPADSKAPTGRKLKRIFQIILQRP